MTNLRSLFDLFRVAKKLAAACAFATAIAAVAAAQTNTFPSSGNAGVGTTTPANKLEVKGGAGTTDATTDGLALSSTNTAYTTKSRIGFNYDRTYITQNAFYNGSVWVPDNTSRASAGIILHSGDADSSIAFHTSATNNNGLGAERMRIDKNGNVGIGTTTPNYKFEVNGSPSRNTLAVIGDGDVVGYAGIKIGAQTTTGIATNRTSQFNLHMRKDSWYGGDGSGPSLIIESVSKVGGYAAPFLITPVNDVILNGGSGASGLSYGNVGIGTTSPAYKLDVVGEIRSMGGIRFADGSLQTTAASGGAVSSVFGRTGAVTAAVNDYTWAQIDRGTSSLADLTTRSATDLTSGTLPDARFPATLPAVSGANLASLNAANLSTGTVGTARLGSGTANSTTFLRGDNSWAAVTSSQWTTNGTSINYGAAGNVGIGVTGTPTEKLHVVGNGKVTGNLTVDGNIAAKYQDLAEWVPSSEQLSAGTVVVLDTTKSNQVISSSAIYDTRVAGVISAQPGITLGESGEGKVLVATTGRVRVKVDASRGPIQIGDLLVTSDIAGVAMKSEAVNLGGVQIHRPGTIIGKALEPLANGKGEILVLLSLQ